MEPQNAVTTIKIALVFPKKGFFKDAFKIFEEHRAVSRELDQTLGFTYILEEVEAPQNHLNISLLKEYDVIISRGITAALIKNEIHDIPVIEIPVAGNDLVYCLKAAKDRYGDQKMAIIGSHNMIYGAEGLIALFGIRAGLYFRMDSTDVRTSVDQAVADGCTVVLGGVETCAYAEGLGLETSLIMSGKEALWQAFTEAGNAVDIQLAEQQKTKRLKAILDYTYEGILEIDRHRRITVCNHMASAILGLGREIDGGEAAGCLVEELFTRSRFREMLCDSRQYEDELVAYQQQKLVVNKILVKVKGGRSRYVVTFQDVTKLQNLEQTIRKQISAKGYSAKYFFRDIIGESQAVQSAVEQARHYAKTEADVMITGESGTGKELFAQSIHNESCRKASPFVAVNCAAINENLLESELFGYVEGAFTGAQKGGKAGLFEQAHRGTIFLDEIAEISPSLQAKLLRVLQEREIMRLGDSKIIPVNIRVIAATNKDLFQMVQDGAFREDLYYRLDVLRLNIPNLNQRGHDISLLAGHFLQELAAEYRRDAVSPVMSKEAYRVLEETDWYGNIRQLHNVCLRLAVLCGPEGKITEQDVRQVLKNYTRREAGRDGGGQENFEREAIRQALEQAAYNRTETARALGMSRSTLWKKMKQYSL